MNFLLVPIPGQSPWVKEESCRQYGKNNTSNPAKQNAIGFESKKRTASEAGNGDDNNIMRNDNTSLDEQKMDIDSSHKNLKIEKKCQNNSHNVIGDTNNMFTKLSETYPGVYDEDDICCLARIYDCEEGADLKLNDMVEVLGIYTLDLVLNERDSRGNSLADMMDPFGGFEAEEEDQSESLPPPSVAPRLHVISFKILGSSFPLLSPITEVTSYIYIHATDILVAAFILDVYVKTSLHVNSLSNGFGPCYRGDF
jgi:hypothetical protein